MPFKEFSSKDTVYVPRFIKTPPAQISLQNSVKHSHGRWVRGKRGGGGLFRQGHLLLKALSPETFFFYFLGDLYVKNKWVWIRHKKCAVGFYCISEVRSVQIDEIQTIKYEFWSSISEAISFPHRWCVLTILSNIISMISTVISVDMTYIIGDQNYFNDLCPNH